MVIYIATSETYPQLVSAPGYSLVFYESDDYRNKERIRRAVRRIAKAYADALRVVVVNVEQCAITTSIDIIPCFQVFCDGKVIGRASWNTNYEELIELVEECVKSE